MIEDPDDIYSDVDSDGFVQDMRSYGVAQALPLEDEGIDDDAAAYLRAVREEASRIPHVTASVRRYGEPEPPVHRDPHGPLVTQPPPMMHWIHSVIDGFMAARQQVHHQVEHGRPHTLDEAQVSFDQPVPGPNDRRAWQRRMQDTSFQPYAETLAQMDNNLAANCLCSLVDEVANLCTPPHAPTQGVPRLSTATSALVGGSLPPHLALWLYGLMVRLEQPVTSEVAAALRRIVTIAEAGLERCTQQLHCNSQDSNGSSADCGGVPHGRESMQEDRPAASSNQDKPVLNETVSDLTSQAVDGEGNDGNVGEQMEHDATAATGYGASSSNHHLLIADGAGNVNESLQLDAGAWEPESSCESGEGVEPQPHGGIVQEVARCDTLRVLAGGFFGQDSALAPLVHDYMRSAQLL